MRYKHEVTAAIDQHAGIITRLAQDIGGNPELGFVEYKACNWLTTVLAEFGYTIVQDVASMPTAFIGERGAGKPTIALLCEYDALPDIGHGCGHNLIGPASVGAAIGLAAVVPPLDGRVLVIGAPGEETGGGKVHLTDEGCLDGIDAAMMFHPAPDCYLMSTSNALDALEFSFFGKTAHAAVSPEEGINALDGVLQLFNGMNALRQHVAETVRMHGIITDGGQAVNIIPDRAVARFYFRAATRHELNVVVEKAKNIARGAALMSGASVEWRFFENSNDNMVPNKALAEVFGQNLRDLGFTAINESRVGKGSSDMGNVSHVVPSIHPYLPIGDYVGHTVEFAQGAVSEKAMETLLLAAKSLAHTAVDLLTDKELLAKVKQEHQDTFAS